MSAPNPVPPENRLTRAQREVLDCLSGGDCMPERVVYIMGLRGVKRERAGVISSLRALSSRGLVEVIDYHAFGYRITDAGREALTHAR